VDDLGKALEALVLEERRMRYIAMGICLALGIGAGLAGGGEVGDVFADPRWLRWAVGGGIAVVVFVALYLPLGRPLADMANDRLSALNQRVRTTRTGSGLDEIPMGLDSPSAATMPACRTCGLPGKPLCDACAAARRGGAGGKPGRPAR
jgi:hypothetical protein